MTSSFQPRLSLVVLGLCIAATAGKAAPVTTPAPLGLPDRDVIRDPYGSIVGTFGGSHTLPNGGIVGPIVGLGGGLNAPLILGGGGGGGGGGGFVGFMPLSAPAGGSVSGPGNGATPGNNTPSGGQHGPAGGLPSEPFNGPLTQNIVVPIQGVPDGGASAILLGCGLLMIFGVGRRIKA